MSGIVKRIISGAIAAALSAPCLGFFPLENAVATGSQADNEALYASVLNHYAEKVIPNGIIGIQQETFLIMDMPFMIWMAMALTNYLF